MEELTKIPKLRRVYRLDSISLDATYYTEEGYLIDKPIVTSVGIFEYTNDDGTRRRELRLPEHVFNSESLASYKGKPVIITHDAGRVDKGNVAHEQVGTILTEGYQDGMNVRCEIIIHDIGEAKKSKLRELSLGYDLVLDETPGEWEGQPYDAIQTQIIVNHLALVGDARAGDHARLNIDGTTKNLLEGGKTKMAKNKRKSAFAKGAKMIKKKLNARRQHRLDEGELKVVEIDVDELIEDADGEDTPKVIVAYDERIAVIKERRADRDENGSYDTQEEAYAYILQLDEDIDELLEIVEELVAEKDFAAAQDEGEAENEDEYEYEYEYQDEDDEEVFGEDEEAVYKVVYENEDEDEDEDENKDEGEEPNEDEGEYYEPEKLVLLHLDGKKKANISKAIEAEVRERTKLLRLGDRLNLDGLEDLSPFKMKVKIIRAVNPSMRLDGKGKRYIEAAFDLAVDTLEREKSTDRQRRQMVQSRADSRYTGGTTANAARLRMNERLMNGGKK